MENGTPIEDENGQKHILSVNSNKKCTGSVVENQLDNISNSTKIVLRHPLDNQKSSSISLESLELDVQAAETVESKPIVNISQRDSGAACQSEDEDEDLSVFQAVLSPDCQDVWLKREGKNLEVDVNGRRKIIPSPHYLSDSDDSDDDISINSDAEKTVSHGFDSPDEIEDSILEKLGDSPEPIPEYTAEEEREDSRCWKKVNVAGSEKRIDMKVIEPYKRVLSHGGYLTSGSHNAIIVFSACFLPHHSRVDYSYVMDNLFCYIVSTLEQLVTDDYVLVYLHGGTAKNCMPSFVWLKRCYQMIDRRLRKNLKRLYLVHPTFWLKTIVMMTKPFVSAKFSKKISFINSLSELLDTLPLEHASIPERVRQYDRIKQSIELNSK